MPVPKLTASMRTLLVAGLAAALAVCGATPAAFANAGGSGWFKPQETEPAPKPRKKAPRAPRVDQRPQAEAPARRADPVKPRRQARRVPRETAPSGLPPEGETRFVNDQVIVRYRLTAPQPVMDALVRRLDLRHLEGRTFRLAGITVHRYEIIDGTPVRQVIPALEADSTVVYAQPNYLYELQQSDASVAAGKQYALGKLAIEAAHRVTLGQGVSVAVIDSGIDADHPEFAGLPVELLDATGEGLAADAHGTRIAGVIAARGTLRGIAPDVKLAGIAAFAKDAATGEPRGTSWSIADAIDRSDDFGARVVNMSFAGPADPLVGRGVAGAVRRDMILVAAAGNAGPESPPLYPSAYPGVIAVTATDRDDAAFSAANRGKHIAIAAPGVDILGPVPGGRYTVASGTSLAAAHVTGLVALILSRAEGLAAKDILQLISASARDLGEPGVDAVFGSGLPDAGAALSGFGS